MSYSIHYKQLFRVDVLHLFFLDNGTDKFESMNEAEQTKQLNQYNLQSVSRVIPTLETTRHLKGHRLVFKSFSSGFSVWTEVSENEESTPLVALSDDLSLTFLLQMRDSLFFNYTELEPANKGQLLYISNRRPPSEPSDFPLLEKNDDYSPIDKRFLLSENGMEEEKIDPREAPDLLGVIRLHMKGSSASLNITGDGDKIISPVPAFRVLFGNRKTYWRYIFNSDQQVGDADPLVKEGDNPKRIITKEAFPLTQTGFISLKLGGKELPNPSPARVKPDPVTHKIFSEIYM